MIISSNGLNTSYNTKTTPACVNVTSEKEQQGFHLGESNTDNFDFGLFSHDYKHEFDYSSILGSHYSASQGMSISQAVLLANSGKINDDSSVYFKSAEEALAEFHANGLSKEINYDYIDWAMSTAILNSSAAGNESPLDIAEYFASTYSALTYRIDNDYTDDEHIQQKNQLDSYMTTKINEYAERFTKSVEDIFGGISDDESQKLQDSIMHTIESYYNEYNEEMKNNGFFNDLKDSDNQWLTRHTDFLVSHLRAIDVNFETPDSLYSIQELSEIKEYSKQACNITKSSKGTFIISDEEIGLRSGLMFLKAEGISKNSDVAQEYKSALSKQLEKMVVEWMDTIDRVSEEERARTRDKEKFPLVNRDAVYKIIDTIISAFNKTGSASEAARAGITTGYNSYKIKEEHNVATRYMSSEFWGNMFTRNGEKDSIILSSNYQRQSNQAQIYNDLSRYFDNMFDDSLFSAKG